jgi:acyl-coenzyme A synthetase/AMP-(fatty) acid ligase
VNLAVDGVLEGGSSKGDAVTGPDFGVYRAMKSSQTIGACVDLINRGGVVALLPTSASDSYLGEIVRQVDQFTRSRTLSLDGYSQGIVALPTSGSTGSPKLVAIPATGVARFLAWGKEHFGFDASTISLSLSPWNFDVSFLDTWAVLAAGGVVVAADTDRLQDTGYLRGLLVEHRPTFVQVVPSTLDALLNAAGDDNAFVSVKDLVLTGGAASRSSRAAVARLFPAAAFHNVYGATEVNDCLIQKFSAAEFSEAETLPLGSPISGCEIVLNSQDKTQRVGRYAEDTEGELLVRTPWMALGYITEGALQPLPGTAFEPYGVLYPMRDRVSCTGGRLTYLGRLDRTIKLRGRRINLDEIEQVVRQTGLAGMACAWVDDSANAQELHVAYTAPGHDSLPASGLKLRLLMSRYLPAFAMPNHLYPFNGAFPLNGNGKPDLSTIKKQVEGD